MTDAQKTSRRRFLGTSVGAGAAAVVGGYAKGADDGRPAIPSADYPVMPIVKLEKLKLSASHGFNYPDSQSPCLMVKLNDSVDGGIGPNKNIVAYSSMCTHMGCIVSYDAGTETFQCPCHFSVFDAGNDGQMVCGHATENLPRIRLHHDAGSGQISAIGIDGHLYGRVGNLL